MFFAKGREAYDADIGRFEELYLNNFGYHSDISEDLSTLRREGRSDYHLLYVARGEIEIANENIITDGEFYIFYPHKPQSYTYKKSDGSLYYWIHFTGQSLPALLSSPRLSHGAHSANGRKKQTDALFALFSDALMNFQDENSAYVLCLLRSVLSLLSLPPLRGYPFSRAAKILAEPKSTVTVGQLADMYKISTEHFIRSFKQAYGYTPQSYRTSFRISHAKKLLANTELSISAVAEQCGFDDQFYFSRIFKKSVGISPSEYKKEEE